MVKENRLVDNLLNTLYERNTFTCDIKTKANPDETNSACWYGLSKIHEILIDGLKKKKKKKKTDWLSNIKNLKIFFRLCITP